LVWFGLDWLDWIGLVWFDLVSCGLVWFGATCDIVLAQLMFCTYSNSIILLLNNINRRLCSSVSLEVVFFDRLTV
jgi:hypothetical protein